MFNKNHLNQIAIALGNLHRIEMLVLMMEGRYFTAKELSYSVGLLPSAATAYLKALVDNGLVKTFKQGKFKYFTLQSSEVAAMVESIMCLASGKEVHRKLPEPDICKARFCFNHVAGEMGVLIYKEMLASQYICTEDNSKIIHLTEKGFIWLRKNELLPDGLKKMPEKTALQCMDWTERVPHLGGFLGGALADSFVKLEWIIRKKNSRAISVTKKGQHHLNRIFGTENLF